MQRPLVQARRAEARPPHLLGFKAAAHFGELEQPLGLVDDVVQLVLSALRLQAELLEALALRAAEAVHGALEALVVPAHALLLRQQRRVAVLPLLRVAADLAPPVLQLVLHALPRARPYHACVPATGCMQLRRAGARRACQGHVPWSDHACTCRRCSLRTSRTQAVSAAPGGAAACACACRGRRLGAPHLEALQLAHAHVDDARGLGVGLGERVEGGHVLAGLHEVRLVRHLKLLLQLVDGALQRDLHHVEVLRVLVLDVLARRLKLLRAHAGQPCVSAMRVVHVCACGRA